MYLDSTQKWLLTGSAYLEQKLIDGGVYIIETLTCISVAFYTTIKESHCLNLAFIEPTLLDVQCNSSVRPTGIKSHYYNW